MHVTTDQFWIATGFLGQGLFTSRMLVQWWASERAGRSVVPVTFWLLSLVGAGIILAYAIYKRDPVIIVGQSTGLFVYIRNLQLMRRKRQTESDSVDDLSSDGKDDDRRLQPAAGPVAVPARRHSTEKSAEVRSS